MATIKMPFDKLVISIQMEGERVAHQSLYDINILVTEEVVVAVCVSSHSQERKSLVSNS